MINILKINKHISRCVNRVRKIISKFEGIDVSWNFDQFHLTDWLFVSVHHFEIITWTVLVIFSIQVRSIICL